MSRYADADIEYVSIATGSTKDHISAVCKAIQKRPRAAVFACTDCAMEVYSAAVELLRSQQDKTVESKSGKNERGCSFQCFFLATNKLACRKLVAGCDDLKCLPVMANDRKLPSLGDGVDAFFKPLAECGSKGVLKYSEGITANPMFSEGKDATTCALVGDPTLAKLAGRYAELKPYLDPRIVGLSEEYVSPKMKGRRVVSIDGFVCGGKITHYCISDNVYKPDAPEVFDCLVTPSQCLSAREIEACWSKYDTVVKDFIRRGLDNQFVDVEAFVLQSSDGQAKTTVKTMEVNCRTFCNQIPVFSRLFGGKSGNGCMFSAAVDLLRGVTPPIDSKFSGSVLRPSGAPELETQRVGVCAYMDPIMGCASLIQSKTGDAAYYAIEGFQAHIYAYGTDQAAARKRCDEFYAELKTTSSETLTSMD